MSCDRLHLLAQTELYLLLLCAYNASNDTSFTGPGSPEDIVLSIVLIILTAAVFIYMLTSAIRFLRTEYFRVLRKVSAMARESGAIAASVADFNVRNSRSPISMASAQSETSTTADSTSLETAVSSQSTDQTDVAIETSAGATVEMADVRRQNTKAIACSTRGSRCRSDGRERSTCVPV